MSVNNYVKGSKDYELKERVNEAVIKGYTVVPTIKEAREIINFAVRTDGIPLRLVPMGAVQHVIPA